MRVCGVGILHAWALPRTHLATGRGVAPDSGRVTDMLVVTTTVRVLNGVHGNTTHAGPAVALGLVLPLGTASLCVHKRQEDGNELPDNNVETVVPTCSVTAHIKAAQNTHKPNPKQCGQIINRAEIIKTYGNTNYGRSGRSSSNRNRKSLKAEATGGTYSAAACRYGHRRQRCRPWRGTAREGPSCCQTAGARASCPCRGCGQ